MMHEQRVNDLVDLDRLPQPDYYNRVTYTQPLQNALVVAARDKLAALLTDITDNTFDKTNNKHIESLIARLKEEVKQAERQNTMLSRARAEEAQQQLTVAGDLLKVNKLEAMVIPSEHGEQDKVYCTLAEVAEGVTEKISLISYEKMITQLTRLKNTAVNNIDDYISDRNNYKLSKNAILKLPKHGKIEEVLREAMALNISRILNLDTTDSSLVTYEGKPALFVPFEDIKLLNEFAKGKTFNAFASSKTYEHYSTINPVGEGLQGDCFIEDFGHATGLFYVCSDTDSMGGYNQNKALRNSCLLYFFDQVVMLTDKFKLDSRLSFEPDEFIMKHTRHGQGRNRTLIEDSSLTAKFDSLINLINHKEQIYAYANLTAELYASEIKRINSALKQPHTTDEKKQLNQLKAQLTTLRNDTIKLGEAIKGRIDKIPEILPLKSRDLSVYAVRQALVLEKLLHNPTLFTDEGRPYKNPWTYRHKNPVKTIKTIQGTDNVLITFDSKVSGDMVGFLKQAGNLNSLKFRSSNQLEISLDDLARLRENMLHPEANPEMNHNKNYLNKNELIQISKAYKVGHRERILNLVDEYQKYMNSDEYTTDEKLTVIDNARIYLQRYIDTAEDKGFGMHVMKKMHFDIQQQLQAMMPPELKPNNIDDAFDAAFKLDRVEMFNKIVASAIRHEKLNSPQFGEFLQDCIDKAAEATNHVEADNKSQELKQHWEVLSSAFSVKIKPSEVVDDEDIDQINPDALLEEALNVQEQLLHNIEPPTVTENVEEQQEEHQVNIKIGSQ